MSPYQPPTGLESERAHASTVPSARYAHPTTEHFVPVFVTLGAADEGEPLATPITGYFLGLSKRSIQLA